MDTSNEPPLNWLCSSQHGVLSKHMLDKDDCEALLELFEASHKATAQVSLGAVRHAADVTVPADILGRLHAILCGYLPVTSICASARVYRTLAGSVVPHVDAPTMADEVTACLSTHTLLVYLTTTADGSGATEFVRNKMTDFGDEDNPCMRHERIVVTPVQGRGVLFAHGILHCASETYGNKYVLVTRVCATSTS